MAAEVIIALLKIIRHKKLLFIYRVAMKASFLALWFVINVLLSGFSVSLHAGAPLWRFTPLTATTLTIPADASATVQYIVTNQSRKTHSLAMKSIPATHQITTGAGICGNSFVLGYQQSCTLTFEINGSLLQRDLIGGPVVCQTSSGDIPNPTACYQPSLNNQLNIMRAPATPSASISASVSTLALSVDCPTLSGDCTISNAALTGTPRIITITNNSASPALSVTYTASLLPPGTTVTPASCDIPEGHTCIFTITPGQTPSAAPGDTTPVPISLNFSGSNTNTISTTVNILTYGSVYQDGYVFAVDDSTLTTTSIGGKVVALSDQSTSMPWQPGYTNSLNCTATSADSYINGVDNTTAIFTALNPGHLPNTYAGGICETYVTSGYSDWYLPSICEMSYHDSGGDPCGDVTSPTLQNIQSSLVDNNIGNLDLSAIYWSSTQNVSGDPLILALFNLFGIAGFQGGDLKEALSYVRCARIF